MEKTLYLPHLRLTLELLDQHGKLIYSRSQPTKCYLRNFLATLGAQFSQASGYYSGKDYLGNTRPLTPYAQNFKANATPGVTTYGTVLGIGYTAVTLTDYVLDSQIAHGSGSGQLLYGSQDKTAIYEEASKHYLYLTRPFTNSSGGLITVKEAGIMCPIRSGSSSYYFLIVRDVIDPTDVADTQILNTTYQIDILL